jgi:hypothetical protein
VTTDQHVPKCPETQWAQRSVRRVAGLIVQRLAPDWKQHTIVFMCVCMHVDVFVFKGWAKERIHTHIGIALSSWLIFQDFPWYA